MRTSRREFLKRAGVVAVAAALPLAARPAPCMWVGVDLAVKADTAVAYLSWWDPVKQCVMRKPIPYQDMYQ